MPDLAPEYGDENVTLPMGAVLDWTMGTPAGIAANRDSRINGALKAILREWYDFLNTPNALYVLNDSTPYGLRTDVRLRDRFWVKGQPYSLHDMLDNDDAVAEWHRVSGLPQCHEISPVAQPRRGHRGPRLRRRRHLLLRGRHRGTVESRRPRACAFAAYENSGPTPVLRRITRVGSHVTRCPLRRACQS